MKIYIVDKQNKKKSKSVEEGQKIIVNSPLKSDFSKKSQNKIEKEKRIAYVYKIFSPSNILINMLSTKDRLNTNQMIERTNKENNAIAIRDYYFVKVSHLDIIDSKKDILDKKEMQQFENIVNTYSKNKQNLFKNSKNQKPKLYIQKQNLHYTINLEKNNIIQDLKEPEILEQNSDELECQ